MSLRSYTTIGLVIIGVAAVFCIDMLTPLGMGEWVLYLIPLLILSRRTQPVGIVICAASIIMLIVLGFALSPHGLPREVSLIARAVGIVTLAVTALLLLQRQQTETALRENEERFRSVFENSMIGVYRTTPGGKFLMANPGLVKMLGYSSFQELAQVAVTWDSICPEGFSRVEFLRRIGRDAQVVGLESAWKRKGGTVLFVRESAWVVWDRRGEVQYFEGTVEDITDHRTVEEARAAERNLLRGLINNLPDRIYVKDHHCRYLIDNVAHAEFLGTPTPDNVVGKTIADFVPPELAEHYDAVDRKLVESGQPLLNIEEVITQPDGTRRWSLTTKVPLHDANGKVVGLVGISRDITHRKEAELALAEQRSQLDALMDNIPDMIFFKNATSRYTQVNRAQANRVGLSEPSQAVGKTDFDFFDDEHARQTYADEQEIMRTGQPVIAKEEKETLPDGRETWVSTTKVPLRDGQGQVVGTFGLSRDITDHRRAEEQLRVQLSALQAAANAIFMTDAKGQIAWVNAAFTMATGYTLEEAIGRRLDFLAGETATPELLASIQETILRGEVWHGELLNRRKNLTEFPADLTVTPVRDEQGALTHFVGIMQDVTEQHRLQEQLLHSQKMEAVGQLAGGVAHDFNNILTAVLGYSELLLQRSPPSDPLHRHAEEIRKSAERAASLTQQLLAFSRRQPVQLRVLDINALVMDLNKMLRRLVGENIRIVTVCSPDLGHVRADAGQLQQIIMNLVINARDAMPDGGTLTLQTANVQFDETYVRTYPEARVGDYVMLAISDTGVGMSAEVKKHLFEPFFTTKGIGGGTGLGLAMCYGIVKQIDGHINVYSEPGQGTAFRIYLPRVTDSVEPAPRRGSQAEIPRGTETILIVEDEPEVRALAVLVLHELGYRMLEAANGEEALQLAEAGPGQQPIHLLVTDVVMPRMGGPHLAEALASRHPETKVLFISGYPDDTLVKHGTVPSNLAFLPKPFTPSALARRVREVLDAGNPNSGSAAARSRAGS
jgi:PAS domain S-box-containing protein